MVSPLTRRYLVVDDNLALAENVAEILIDLGAEALSVNDAVRALELIATQRFDALVTDVKMPGIDGVELLRRARTLDPGLPAVVWTAYSNDAALAAVERLGVLGVLAKPPQVRELLAMLERAHRVTP